MFSSIKPSETDQDLLIEFEEVVLSSGLPMNEIWLRVEKLRTNFYFLPCPAGFKCSDPQRMVFNEDVCQFVYPLRCRENSLKLVFIILRLLKVPLPVHSSAPREESEWDSVENLLPTFIYPQLSGGCDSAFDSVLWDLMKELNMGPSFFASHIGHAIYTNTVQQFLLLLPECFAGVEKMVLNLIWLRFERLLVVIAARDGKLTDELRKAVKGKFKKFLKLEANRNEINYFVEYALLELALGNREAAIAVLESSFNQGIGAGVTDMFSDKDKFYIAVTLVEIFLLPDNQRVNDAVTVLVCLGLNSTLNRKDDVPTDAQKLIALGALSKNLNQLTEIEANVVIMEEEQLHLPDYLINSIKCLIYMEAIIKSKAHAVKTLNELIKTFNGDNLRHSWVRERLFELRIAIKGITGTKDAMITTLHWKDFEEAVKEFPNNLFIIKRMVNCKGLMWYKTKSLTLKSNSSFMVIFLIASVRLWFKEAVQRTEADCSDNVTQAHRLRVKSLLQEVVQNNEKLKRNAVLWRLYLRVLFELENSFNQCKNALFSALDECPWSKSLYLDGAVFVPHELTQIQDLIIEKQLRIYALPEELEILRSDT